MDRKSVGNAIMRHSIAGPRIWLSHLQQHQEVIVAGKGVRTQGGRADAAAKTRLIGARNWSARRTDCLVSRGRWLKEWLRTLDRNCGSRSLCERQVMAPATRDFRRAIAETRGPSRGRSPRADSTRARWTRRGVGEQRLVVFTEQTCDVSDVVLCCPSHSAGGCAQVHRPYS